MGNKNSEPTQASPWANVAKATKDSRTRDGQALGGNANKSEVHTSAIKLPANIVFSSLKYSSEVLSFDLIVAEPCSVAVYMDDSLVHGKEVLFGVGKHSFKGELKLNSKSKLVIVVKAITESSSDGSAPSRLLRVTCKLREDGRLLIFGKQAEINGKAVELEEVYGISGAKECVICITESPDTTLIPCRHMCACDECAGFLMTMPPAERKCPVCRSLITSTVKVNVAH